MRDLDTLMVPMASSDEVTQLLQRLSTGDTSAEAELSPHIYRELRKLAAKRLRREKPGHTLQTTELVNEAYIRLAGNQEVDWQGKTHFFAVASQVMRHVLTDYARRKNAAKRGGGVVVIPLQDDLFITDDNCDLIERLDSSLDRLKEIDPKAARVVELRFFGGLSEREIAHVTNVSERTVKRLWVTARAWLRSALSEDDE